MKKITQSPLPGLHRLLQSTFLAVFLTPLPILAQDNVFINEISVNTTSTDWEFVELLGSPGELLGHLTLLVIESDDQASMGQVDRAISLSGQAIDSNGYFTAGSPAAETAYSTTFDLSIPDNTFENSTTTYLLVADFSGEVGDDLDTNNDGTLDVMPWTRLVDSVNLRDDDLTDVSYSPDSVGPDGSNLPPGTYRCSGSFGSNMLSFSTADGTPGALNSQCAAPTVYLNEFVISTDGTDWEFFEVQGTPGTDLGGNALISVESDNGTSAGRIDAAVDLAGPIPRDGFWVAMSTQAATTYGFNGDGAISNNFFENSTTSNMLVFGFTGSVGDDIDTDNDGTIDATFWDSIADGVSFRDSGATDFNYSGGPVVGPDGSFLPAGGIRCPNAPGGAFSTANLQNFNDPESGTPGVANTCDGPPAPPQVAATDPENGREDVASDAFIHVEFNRQVDLDGLYAQYSCLPSGISDIAETDFIEDVKSFDIFPGGLIEGDRCIVTVFSESVSISPPVADNLDAGAGEETPILMLDGDGDGIEGGDYIFSFVVKTPVIFGECGDDATLIHDIQGTGNVSPLVGEGHVIEGVVVGDYQETSTTNPPRPELQGFFLQEEDVDNDGDPATSEGIFVFDPDKTLEVEEGDIVRVSGVVAEAFGNTQLGDIADMLVCDTGATVSPASVDLPIPMGFANVDDFWEQYEGMLLSFVDTMTVSEQFELARYGKLLMAEGGVLRQYSQDAALPLNEPDFNEWLDDQARRSIKLDDYNAQENIDPVFHPQPGGFAVDNYIRIGATTSLVGVLDYRFDEWSVQPQKTNPVAFVNTSRMPSPQFLESNIEVAAMNVLNYFNGDGLGGGFPTSRGANTQAELDRQTSKIVQAIEGLDADVLGLIEIENDGDGANDALAYLVDAINAEMGAGTYAYVPAGMNGGTDDIKVALIYKPAVVEMVGTPQSLTSAAFTNPNGLGTQQNRPALAQTFRVTDAANPDVGSAFTAVVVHMKSKGSGCGAGDDSVIEGNCSDTRAKGAMELVNWLATDPTDTLTNIGVVDPDIFIVGDFNSYYQENPMQVFYNAGYINKIAQADHGYVFNGNWGSLDYILVTPGLLPQTEGAAPWNINADENQLLDYNDTIEDAGEAFFNAKPPTNPLYEADEFRSSDHDPVITGADLADAPEVSSTDPANGAIDVDLGSNITITFDTAVVASAGSFTIECNETGVHTFVLSGGPTTWTLNPDIDFGLTESCSVTVIANKVWEPVGYTTMIEDYVFSFETSANSRAVITVTKDFNDGNPGEVDVLLDCNTGLILDQDKTITEDRGVEFIVTQFDPTELDCTVTEIPVPGYETLYDNGVTLSEVGCVFEEIMTTTVQNCVVHNHLLPVDFTVTKEWVINGLGDELPMEASADYTCYNLASIDPEQCAADSVEVETPFGESGYLSFSGSFDTDGFSLLPHWNGNTYCVVTEDVDDDSVESDDSACQNVPVMVGDEVAGCTIVNTRFFEGIPTLSRFNLVLLAMLMMITSLVAVRRFGS